MSAYHHHEHSHAPKNYNRAFIIGIMLNGGFVAIEATYGIFANSLALLADAGHNLSDVLGLVLAWGASILSRRLPTSSHTYGLRRSSILAALFNAIFLLLVTEGIAWEAVQRFRAPSSVEGSITLVMPTGCPNDGFLTQLCSELHNLFATDHGTIQVKVRSPACALALSQLSL